MAHQSSPNALFRNDDNTRLPVATIANERYRVGRTRNTARNSHPRSCVHSFFGLLSLAGLAVGVYILYQNGTFGKIINSDSDSGSKVPDRDVLDDEAGLISVTFDSVVSDEVSTAFKQAALIWNKVITDDFGSFTLGSRNFNQQPGCEKYKRSDTVTGIEIVASLVELDGEANVLASAQPCLFETGLSSDQGFRVRAGIMKFDSADIETLVNDNALSTVVLHEMGHVLGLGTMWQGQGLLTQDENQLFEYIGSSGVQAYKSLGGTNFAVPVESSLGTGSSGGHWAEDTFDSELMTPIIDKGVINPLSSMSIKALEDLGYTVNVSRAEAYSIPSSTGATALRAAPDLSTKLDLSNDVQQIDFESLRLAIEEAKSSNLRGN